MKKRLGAMVLSLAVFAVSCGDKVDRDGSAEVIAEQLGVDVSVGRCVVDGSIDALGEQRLVDIENGALPTDSEVEAVLVALAACGG